MDNAKKKIIKIIFIIIMSLIFVNEVLGETGTANKVNINEDNMISDKYVCIQEGYVFNGGNYNEKVYKNPTDSEVKKALDDSLDVNDVRKIAYIFAKGVDDGEEISYSLKNTQQALWYVLGESKGFQTTYKYNGNDVYYHTFKSEGEDLYAYTYFWNNKGKVWGETKRDSNGDTRPECFQLYLDAVEYAKNENKVSISVIPETPGYLTSEDEVIVGPIMISTNAEMINLKAKVGDTYVPEDNYKYYNKSDQKVSFPSVDQEFYIHFDKTYFENIKGQPLTFEVNKPVYKITEMRIYTKDDDQKLAKFVSEKKEENATDSITLPTLTETPETPTKEQVSIKVKKIWDDQGYTGTKPTQIKINIYRNGILLHPQKTVNTGSSNTGYIEIGTFDKCDSDGNEYTYIIDEEVITGTNYTYAPESITGGKTADGKSYEFTITNKYSPPKPTFEKENTDSLPPIKIQINKVLERNR